MIKNTESIIYQTLGASSSKESISSATKNVPKGLFKNSFCRIFPDYLDDMFCNIAHSDGAGTKSILAYIDYKENTTYNSFSSIGHDSLIMNLDDVICCGFTNNFQYVSTINRNLNYINDGIIANIIDGTCNSIRELKKYNINIEFCGGETADVGDICKTILVDGSLFSRGYKWDVISNDIKPGHVIVGLSSTGKAVYEDCENSGIGSNGLSLARKAILNDSVSSYLEIKSETPYFGKYSPNSVLPGSNFTALSALLSPTRTFSPIIKEFLSDENNRKNTSGIIHNTGGGQLKSLKFANNLVINKTIPYPFPIIFQEIQKSANINHFEMAKIFNLGWRMEVYCSESAAQILMDISNLYNVEARIIGYVEKGINKLSQLKISIDGDLQTFSKT